MASGTLEAISGEEIDFEIDEIIRYLDEVRLTKAYLRRQIETMNKSN